MLLMMKEALKTITLPPNYVVDDERSVKHHNPPPNYVAYDERGVKHHNPTP